MSYQPWIPIESNPEVFNKFIKQLGFPIEEFSFCDIYGLDEDLLSMVPRPVLSVVLLFPFTKEFIQYSDNEEKKQNIDEISSKIWFMKQLISNSCGTVAIIHSLANIIDKQNVEVNGWLKSFLDRAKSLNPDERGESFANDESIKEIHHNFAQSGQTKAPSIEEVANFHFCCFVNVDNKIYELDGRRKLPIFKGHTSENSFLEDTAKCIKHMISQCPSDLQFSMMALTKKQ